MVFGQWEGSDMLDNSMRDALSEFYV